MLNILIVDDEDAVRLSIRYLANFEKRGITGVYEASNANEARAIMHERTIHILLTDICMNGQDGLFLMNWTYKHFPKTKIIAISGHQDFNYILQAMRSGAMDYLVKPINPERLNSLLEKATHSIEESETIAQVDVFEEMKGYLEQNYDKPVNLDELAKLFELNPSYVSRRFKQKFGMGVVDYITSIRIRKAKEFLVATDAKIIDVATAVGYDDEKYFSRVFSKSVGVSPNTWRKKIK